MISDNSLKIGLRAVLFVLVLFALAGYAAQQAGEAAKPDSAVTLAYKFPEGKTLTYRQTTNETQNLEIMGQAMSTQSNSTLEFSLKPKGLKDENFSLGVIIDAFKANMTGPQGDVSPDTSSVPGKGFDMILSRLGKEIDTSGASSIQYEFATSKRDISSTFQAFFPDLPARPVKVGESWPSEDTVIQKSDSGVVRISVKNVNTLDGIETVDGYECIRVKSTSKGTLTGNLEQGGVGMSLDCTIEGSDTWYFAVKEGIYIKADTKAAFGGSINAGEPVNQAIPLTGETRGEVRLLKK
jgi:hypothetical protein